MRRRIDRWPVDLALAGGLVLLTVLAVWLDWGVLRVVLGIPFLLVVPGYLLLLALFPEHQEEPAEGAGLLGRGITTLERAALSLALSVAVVPLVGLLLNVSPWGIRLVPLMASLVLLDTLLAAVALWRWLRLPRDERWCLAWDPDWFRLHGSRSDKALTLALYASALFAVGALVYGVVTPRQAEPFTEFYVLGDGGRADCYPSRFDGLDYRTAGGAECPPHSANVTVGVINHEHHDQTYWLRAVWTLEPQDAAGNRTVEAVEVWREWNVTLPHRDVELEPRATFDHQYLEPLQLPPPPFEGTQRLSLQLFLDPPPPAEPSQAYMDSPHRRLHLWIEA